MKLKPRGKFLAVEPVKDERRESGIIVPSGSAVDHIERGKVIAAGSEVKGVKDGDTVLFMSYNHRKVDVGDVTCFLVKDEDLYAVIDA